MQELRVYENGTSGRTTLKHYADDHWRHSAYRGQKNTETMDNSIRSSENPEMIPSQMVFVPDEIAADGGTVSDVTITQSDFEMTDKEMEVRTFIALVVVDVLKKCKSKSDYGEMTTITLAHQLMIGIMKDYPITEWVFPILSSKKVAA
ncbi:unnamed protein product [Pleuronectes platessa]|uniref:Uncharacterized protein n=1 Tax=Pleuronectes platessa TaxID=8262 RepID=A0A9N7U3C6_PLEPL|nr:unnamed protein product [Pleuronectes platessa]